MNIFPLMELIPTEVEQKVLSLIELKSTAKERFIIELDNSMRSWIYNTFEECMEEVKNMDKQYFDVEQLNTFFKKTIMG